MRNDLSEEESFSHGPRRGAPIIGSAIKYDHPSCGYIHDTILVDDDLTPYYGKLPVPITLVPRPI